jgi:hypothetical protein
VQPACSPGEQTREVEVESGAPESRGSEGSEPLLELEPEPASFGSPPEGVPAELHATTVSHNKENHKTLFMASSPRGEPPPVSVIVPCSKVAASMVCRWDGQGKHMICASDILGRRWLGEASAAWPHARARRTSA